MHFFLNHHLLDLHDGYATFPVMTKPLLRFARRLRTQDTKAEDLLWQALRGRRFEGAKFRRQVPLAGYIADFCCFDLGLTIELDGVHHEEQAARDMARRTLIEEHGYLELRFSNADVQGRLDWVVAEIGRAIDIARNREMRKPFPRFEP